MDYPKFIAQLPALYESWGQESIRPKSGKFQAVLDQITGMTTPNVLQLLNFAVECLEPGEVYCEVGCFQGSTLIGALLDHPDRMAYAVDNFSEFDFTGENQESLMQNLVNFGIEEQVLFCNQGFEEFFADLRELQNTDRIGVYLYDGAHDYRSQLMGLLLAEPFLADRALIVVDDSNWDGVQQANLDFIATHPQCELVLDLPTPANGHPSFWNGVQVLSWDRNANHSRSWIDLYKKRKVALIQAIYDIPAHALAVQPNQLDGLYQQAQASQQAGQLAEATQYYLTILLQDGSQHESWHGLGQTYYASAQYKEAHHAFSQAIALDPTRAVYHYSLGLVLEKLANLPLAAQAYQQAIDLAPNFIDAYNNLGNLVAEHGDPQQAERIYRQAIDQNPNSIGSYLNLGNLLLAQGWVEAAIKTYETAFILEPDNSDIQTNLQFARDLAQDQVQLWQFAASHLFRRHRYQEAADFYQKLLAAKRTDLEYYQALAHCYHQLKQYQTEIEICQAGISQHPTARDLHTQLIQALQQANSTKEAIAQAERSAIQFPHDLLFQLQKCLTLPVLYQSEAEIADYRKRFTQGLNTVVEQNQLDTPLARQNAIAALSQHNNFFLAYQNANDRDLQQQFGQLAHRIMAANYPQWVKPLPLPEGKVRIGYVSGCMRDHTVGKLMVGWLRHHDRSQFEIYSYHLFDIDDALSQEFRQHSDAFYQIPNDLEAVCQQIRADQLHVLVFLEIGMQSIMTQLAALRLAPVQCTTWAHPVTSGLPTVDYFLSSDLMEPDNAQEHYSEKLIRLPNIGIAFAKPEVLTLAKSRSAFQLRDDAVVYLTSQMLSKYLPQQDRVFAAIARRVPNAQFVFIARPNPIVAEQLQQRLQRAFAAVDLDSADFCIMLPPVDQADYWSLNQLADVFLDSFGWSGGHTTLEAIACNLPVVTCPGEFMRGRHSYAILKMLGTMETIASSEADYINIAVRLGQDVAWREAIVQQMITQHPNLYNDTTCVTALEEFYRQVTNPGLS